MLYVAHKIMYYIQLYTLPHKSAIQMCSAVYVPVVGPSVFISGVLGLPVVTNNCVKYVAYIMTLKSMQVYTSYVATSSSLLLSVKNNNRHGLAYDGYREGYLMKSALDELQVCI